MASTKIISFRAKNERQQRGIMESKLRSIQHRHPDARIVSVNVNRRSALQWNPCQLEGTMVVEWADPATAGGTAPTSATSGSVTDPSAWRNWTDETGRLTTPAKIVRWLLFWPFLAAWWLWKNPRFTMKTKAIVTAVSVAAIALSSVFGDTGKTIDVSATTGTTSGSETKPTPTTTFDAFTDQVTPAGVSCEELSGMWESARLDSDLVQGARYVAAWDKYCSQYGSIVTHAN